MYAMFGVIASLPATLILWLALAGPTRAEDGKVNLAAIKRQLLIVLISFSILTLGLSIPMVIDQTSFYGGSVIAYMLAIAILLGVGTAGAYMSIYYPAKKLNEKSRVTKGKWFLMTLGFSILTLLAEYIVFIVVSVVASVVASSIY